VVTDDRTEPFPEEPETEEMEAREPASAVGDEPEGRRAESTGIAWGAILLMLGIALVVVFAVQNTNPVPVNFLWMEGQFPLAIVILITIGAVVLITELIGVSYRRRRRKQRQDRDELKRFRGA
jgi:uncharacterized integral membrane protein